MNLCSMLAAGGDGVRGWVLLGACMVPLLRPSRGNLLQFQQRGSDWLPSPLLCLTCQESCAGVCVGPGMGC